MKNKLLIIILLFTSQIYAQGAKPQIETPESRTELLNHLLELEVEQESQIIAIFKDSEQKVNTLKSQKKLSESEKNSAFMKIKHDEEVSVNSVLNEMQKGKLSENGGLQPQKSNINTSRSNIKQDN